MSDLPASSSGVEHLIEPLLRIHDRIRDAVVQACDQQSSGQLAAVVSDAASDSDTIYSIDRVGEQLFVEGLAELGKRESIYLVGEGLPNGAIALPNGLTERECHWRVLIDPIDGTRGLMYQKRSAWILTGVAQNRGDSTRLRDIVFAVQTEIPLVKQHQSDQLWAVRGHGGEAWRYNRLTCTRERLTLRPSTAAEIDHGFATLVRFFPGARDILAAVDDDVALSLVPTAPGKAGSFEDQYMSTGGQLYELIAGHDRFIADVRPLVQSVRETRGLPRGLCCHPYDLCTALVAEEAGVILTNAAGDPVDAPFDAVADVSWVGYANARLRRAIEPVLQDALRRRGLL